MYKVEFKSKIGVDIGWYPISYKFQFLNGDILYITTDKGIDEASKIMEKSRDRRIELSVTMKKLY
jgi:hypothetical protein